jgi:hypothetical protein
MPHFEILKCDLNPKAWESAGQDSESQWFHVFYDKASPAGKKVKLYAQFDKEVGKFPPAQSWLSDCGAQKPDRPYAFYSPLACYVRCDQVLLIPSEEEIDEKNIFPRNQTDFFDLIQDLHKEMAIPAHIQEDIEDRNNKGKGAMYARSRYHPDVVKRERAREKRARSRSPERDRKRQASRSNDRERENRPREYNRRWK